VIFAQITAWIAIIILFGLVCFQLALVIGLPYGKAAWGGKHTRLPPGLRIASLFSAALLTFAVIIVLERAEVFSIINNPTLIAYGIWIFTVFFALNTVMNFVSRSRLEKCIMTPTAAVLCVCFMVTAIVG
jgi:hypothetical protein